jgi:hypothetical protein
VIRLGVATDLFGDLISEPFFDQLRYNLLQGNVIKFLLMFCNDVIYMLIYLLKTGPKSSLVTLLPVAHV